jgi:hypothetical protein
MKLKSIITTITIIASLIIFSGAIQAQGLYSKKTAKVEETETLGGSGIYRDGSDDWGNNGGDQGENGEGPGGEPDKGKPSPIGEGTVILSLLAGGYAIFRKKQYK